MKITDYSIQKTKTKNDYIVRDFADRQIVRCQTEKAAKDFIKKLVETTNAETERENIERDEREKKFKSFNQRQIAWQKFRNILYDVQCWKSRNNEKIMKYVTSKRKQNVVLDSMERTDELIKLYQNAVEIDTKLKHARDESKMIDYIAFLEIAEKFMTHNETAVSYYA